MDKQEVFIELVRSMYKGGQAPPRYTHVAAFVAEPNMMVNSVLHASVPLDVSPSDKTMNLWKCGKDLSLLIPSKLILISTVVVIPGDSSDHLLMKIYDEEYPVQLLFFHANGEMKVSVSIRFDCNIVEYGYRYGLLLKETKDFIRWN